MNNTISRREDFLRNNEQIVSRWSTAATRRCFQTFIIMQTTTTTFTAITRLRHPTWLSFGAGCNAFWRRDMCCHWGDRVIQRRDKACLWPERGLCRCDRVYNTPCHPCHTDTNAFQARDNLCHAYSNSFTACHTWCHASSNPVQPLSRRPLSHLQFQPLSRLRKPHHADDNCTTTIPIPTHVTLSTVRVCYACSRAHARGHHTHTHTHTQVSGQRFGTWQSSDGDCHW